MTIPCVNVHTPAVLRSSFGLPSKVNRRNIMGVLNKATARVHGAVDDVADAAAPAAQWLDEHGETLGNGGEKLLQSASKYVAAHPLQSLALALAAGYLLSRITR
jgi:ElaB/YqjD/DUF883 family membrane-anchored ribosome-binding protein